MTAESTISSAARAYLRWALIDGIGPIRFARIIERFGSADAAARASHGQFTEISGIGRETAEKIERGLSDDAVIESEVAAAAKHGVSIICREDANYPPALLKIPDPPIVLFVKGELRRTDAISVAVVGSRRCSIYGGEQARRFGELLANAGITVISGLARGIDAFAHHGAVDAGGRSIAVLGSGLNDIYPPENRPLAERLLQHGVWLAEAPMLAPVRASNFPSRNRIIAGMTLGTLVVEAAARSGALITARLAMEYNREVFAIPGRLQEATCVGTNALIRDGATLVTCLDDILDELGDLGAQLKPRQSPPTLFDAEGMAQQSENESSTPTANLSAGETALYGLLSQNPITQEALISRCEISVGDALAALTSLELKGLAKRTADRRIQRAR
ncbi:MAG: DNA-protecting protein DprA [Phycisphaerales bacterium]|nr:DNA-protecting protein DprA [Phycisphaerales bacterium]